MAGIPDLTARLVVDNTSFNRALDMSTAKAQQSAAQMEQAFQKTGTALATLGGVAAAFAVGALVEVAEGAFNAASKLTDLSQQTDFSTASLANLDIILAKNGANLDQFAAAINIMKANLGNATEGNKKLLDAFDQLGLSVTKLQALGPEQAFYAIAKSLYEVDDATKQAELGRDVFGRGFAKLLPSIKDTNGELGATVDQMNALNGEALNAATKKLDDIGDSFSSVAKTLRNDFIIGLAATIGAFEKLGSTFDKITPSLGTIKAFFSYIPGGKLLGDVGSIATTAAAIGLQRPEQFGPPIPAGYKPPSKNLDPRGNNDDLRKVKEKKAKAVGDAPDYDDSQFDKYINSLQEETKAVGESARAHAMRTALSKAQNDAERDFNAGLRDSAKLLPDEAQNVQDLAGHLYDLQETFKENKQLADEWKETLSDGLTSLVTDFQSAGKAAEDFFKTIASNIIKQKITGPFSSGITDLLSGKDSGSVGSIFGSIGKFLGFRAEGGPVGTGGSYIVGEKGPELFTPNVAGSITPNNKLGGGGGNMFTTVVQISAGVSQTVRAEIMNLMPSITSAATAGTIQAVQQGGGAARVFNLRS